MPESFNDCGAERRINNQQDGTPVQPTQEQPVPVNIAADQRTHQMPYDKRGEQLQRNAADSIHQEATGNLHAAVIETPSQKSSNEKPGNVGKRCAATRSGHISAPPG